VGAFQLAGGVELRHNSVVKITGSMVVGEDVRTRDLVARSILENGPSTAAILGERLALTATGIRRHLELLIADGLIEAREPRSLAIRGRGRPSKVFVMSNKGRERFEHSYDDLAVAALKFMSAQSGNQLVDGFAQSRADDIERMALDSMSKGANKTAALASFLTEQGYAASVDNKVMGQELIQHHCPIAHVAAEFPQLCEAETSALSKILGTHVQRLATIAHGDGVCTTFIPKLPTTTNKKSKTSRNGERA
jgi:predicted ArsR family transcriptional regulator